MTAALDRRREPRPVLPDRALPPGAPVLGQIGRCWCGAPIGHDWAGKADGRPHPRTGGPQL